MEKIWVFRIMILFSIILFCSYALEHPLYKPLNLYVYEGKEYYLNNFVVNKKLGPNVYEVRSKYGNQSAIVRINSVLQKGQMVSFFGYVNDGVLIAKKYHIHDYPNFPVYFSFLALPLLFFVFIKEWRENRRFPRA